jgi:hypothetical protein
VIEGSLGVSSVVGIQFIEPSQRTRAECSIFAFHCLLNVDSVKDQQFIVVSVDEGLEASAPV